MQHRAFQIPIMGAVRRPHCNSPRCADEQLHSCISDLQEGIASLLATFASTPLSVLHGTLTTRGSYFQGSGARCLQQLDKTRRGNVQRIGH